MRFRANARKLILGSIATPLDHLSVKEGTVECENPGGYSTILGYGPGGEALVFRGGYHPLKRTFKHTLSTYFSLMKTDPNCAFLHTHLFFFFFFFFQYFTILRGLFVIPKGHYSENSMTLIISKGHYSENNIRVIIPKITWGSLFPNSHYCTPKRCTHVHCLVLENNPNYVNIFFYDDDIQLQIQVAPGGTDVRLEILTTTRSYPMKQNHSVFEICKPIQMLFYPPINTLIATNSTNSTIFSTKVK